MDGVANATVDHSKTMGPGERPGSAVEAPKLGSDQPLDPSMQEESKRPEKRARTTTEDERIHVLDLLACVGDRAGTLEAVKTDITDVVETLMARFNVDPFASFELFGPALVRCGLELPYKASVYACAAFLFLSHSDTAPFATGFAKKLATTVIHSLFGALRDGQAARGRRSLRFLGELAKARVISSAYLAAVLETIVKNVHEELTRPSQGCSNAHARGEFLGVVVFGALPWCGKFMLQHEEDALQRIMIHFEAIRTVWKPHRWRAVEVGDERLGSECFGELLNVVFMLNNVDWETNSDLLPQHIDLFDHAGAGGPEVALDEFSLPSHSKLTRYAPPRFRLCLISPPELLDDKDGSEEPDGKSAHMEFSGLNTGVEEDAETNGSGAISNERHMTVSTTVIDKFILRQYVSDVLDNFSCDHLKAAERLLSMQMLANANDVIVETVFSEMCALPMPGLLPVFYGTIFVDLCKVRDSRLPVKLLAGVEKMFCDSGSLDPEVFDRLTEWFAFHLSNFGYKWNWADWAVYADRDMIEKFPFRALFCRDVLDRAIRLSYRDRISNLVPSDMELFLPPPIGKGNPVRFDENITGQVLSIVAGTGKQPPPVVKERLEMLLPASSFDGDETKAGLARLVALMRTILQGSAKTLSHFDTLIERYLPLLLQMVAEGGTVARQAITLESGIFWTESHVRCLYVLDKLSTYRLIDGLAILDFVLSDVSFDESTGETVSLDPEKLQACMVRSHIWELARLVFQRARSRFESARGELTTMSGVAASATEGDAAEVEVRLQSAKTNALNAKAELQQLVLLGLRRLFKLYDIVFTSYLEKVASAGAAGENADDGSAYNGSSEKEKQGPAVDEPMSLFAWRVLGMVKEIGRKHPEQLGTLVDGLAEETVDVRVRHPRLEEALQVLREIAGCDIQPTAA